MLKKLDFKSILLNTLQPLIWLVKSFKSGKGYASCRVLLFKSRKSEQGLAPPPALLTICKADVQSVLLLAETGLTIPSLIISSQAFLPSSAFFLLLMIGLRFALQGS